MKRRKAGYAASMSFLGLGGLLLLVPLVLFVILAIGSIARAVFIPAGVARRPACGGCGHECAEPLTDRCNECGGRLVKVGLVTPALAVRLRGGLASALIGWTALYGVGCGIGATIAQQAAWAAGTGTSTTTTTRTMEPVKASGGLGRVDPSKLDFRVEVASTSTSSASRLSLDSLRFELRRNGTRRGAVLEIDGTDGSYTMKSLDGKSLGSGKTFTSTQTEAMFEAAFIDSSYPAVRTSMTSFTDLVERAAQDPGTLDQQTTSWDDQAAVGELRFGGGSSTNTSGMGGPPSVWSLGWVRIASVVGAAGYVVGLVLITARFRRLASGHATA